MTTIWERLRLQPTNDIKLIKSAYAKLIKQYRPDTHPVEYQAIRSAFDEAMKIAQRDNMLIQISISHDESQIPGSQSITDSLLSLPKGATHDLSILSESTVSDKRTQIDQITKSVNTIHARVVALLKEGQSCEVFSAQFKLLLQSNDLEGLDAQGLFESACFKTVLTWPTHLRYPGQEIGLMSQYFGWSGSGVKNEFVKKNLNPFRLRYGAFCSYQELNAIASSKSSDKTFSQIKKLAAKIILGDFDEKKFEEQFQNHGLRQEIFEILRVLEKTTKSIFSFELNTNTVIWWRSSDKYKNYMTKNTTLSTWSSTQQSRVDHKAWLVTMAVFSLVMGFITTYLGLEMIESNHWISSENNFLMPIFGTVSLVIFGMIYVIQGHLGKRSDLLGLWRSLAFQVIAINTRRTIFVVKILNDKKQAPIFYGSLFFASLLNYVLSDKIADWLLVIIVLFIYALMHFRSMIYVTIWTFWLNSMLPFLATAHVVKRVYIHSLPLIFAAVLLAMITMQCVTLYSSQNIRLQLVSGRKFRILFIMLSLLFVSIAFFLFGETG